MSIDTPRPERVTLTDEERGSLADAFDHEVEANCWRDDCDAGIWESVERILAAREADVLRRVADEWQAQQEAAPTDWPSSWSRGYVNGVETAIANLRAEADRIEGGAR